MYSIAKHRKYSNDINLTPLEEKIVEFQRTTMSFENNLNA